MVSGDIGREEWRKKVRSLMQIATRGELKEKKGKLEKNQIQEQEEGRK